MYFDVSGDNRLTPLDALRVINALSRINRGGEAEMGNFSSDVDTATPTLFTVSSALSINRLDDQEPAVSEPTVDAPEPLLPKRIPNLSAATINEIMQALERGAEDQTNSLLDDQFGINNSVARSMASSLVTIR